jgi:hypothetical protein
MIQPYTDLKSWHPGGTCILICNGPGLVNIPASFLTLYPTLGCNRITMLYPGFCPTYYFGMGSNQMDTPEKRMTILPTIMDDRCKAAFINRLLIHEFAHTNKCYSWLGGRTYGATEEQIRQFSHNPMMAVGLGYTMAFPMLQVAFYMGFETVLIVGMDHEYPDTKHKHFYDDDQGYIRLFETAPGPYTTQAWKRGADTVLQRCRDEYDKAKRMIVNLSEPTKCDIFEKGSWKDWA